MNTEEQQAFDAKTLEISNKIIAISKQLESLVDEFIDAKKDLAQHFIDEFKENEPANEYFKAQPIYEEVTKCKVSAEASMAAYVTTYTKLGSIILAGLPTLPGGKFSMSTINHFNK
jgi:hypothetical protein